MVSSTYKRFRFPREIISHGVVKLFGVQQFSGAAGHHTERRSGSGVQFSDFTPHLESGADFGAVVGGVHPVAGRAEVRGDATERGQKPLG